MMTDIPREGREQMAENHRREARCESDSAIHFRALAETARSDARRYDELADQADRSAEYFARLAKIVSQEAA